MIVSSELDLYRLGYQRLFDTALFGKRLTLAPAVELAVLDFAHRQRIDRDAIPAADISEDLDIGRFDGFSPGDYPSNVIEGIIEDPAFAIAIATDIDRTYTEVGLRLGGEAEYWLGENLSLTAELYDSVPLDERPEIFTANIGLRLRVFESDRAALYLHASAGRETLEYENDRDDLRAEYRDLLQGGVSLRF